MADPTPVNGQITDAVTQANLTILGQAPAVAMGTMQLALAHSMAVLFANATVSQKIAQSDTPDTMLALLSVLKATSCPQG